MHGKRTLLGMLDDAQNSMSRFVQNNFQDKARQDAMDIFNCNVSVINTILEKANQKHASQLEFFTEKKQISILIGTFNINAKRWHPSKENDLNSWIHSDAFDGIPSLIVLGFQELVPLTPTQLMITDPAVLRDWEKVLSELLPSHVLLTSSQLVGAAAIIFGTKEISEHIRNIQTSTKKVSCLCLT